MATLREEIQAKIDSYKAELATLEQHLASGGAHLDQEASTVKEWFTALVDRIRAKL